MAPSDSEPCTQRPPAEELQPAMARDPASEERAPAAGTFESAQAPAEAARQAQAEAEKKKDRAAEAAESVGVEVARRPAAGEESARERLKRHRTEMAGRVRIPEMWGKERMLKDWVDCAVFDRPLAATTGLLTARDALVAECAAARPRPAHGSTGRPLRVQNGCS
ncbi:protein BIC1-like [Phragmites australis]|uniref:protein BIC1-like n=1 Tax=Phragmites australis TaxID=29695 RepID=UPI002D79AD47|nr:protein BIC1-like [Phragmites australis]